MLISETRIPRRQLNDPFSRLSSVRPATGQQFRGLVNPIYRQKVLTAAVHGSGPANYLHRIHSIGSYGNRPKRVWKAFIGGRNYFGSFKEITDQIVPLLSRLL